MTSSAPALPIDAPHVFIGLARLMRQAFSGADLKPLAAALIEHVTRQPEDANALMDLATTLLLNGHRDIALSTQMEALQMQQIYSVPATGETTLRVLALMAPGDLMANTPLEFLLENASIALDMAYVGVGIPALSDLPEHDVMFVAIGHSNENDLLLSELDAVVSDWPRPVINRPAYIMQLARDRACNLLQGLPGVAMPVCLRVGRAVLQQIGNATLALTDLLADAAYPVIVRPLDSHAGEGLLKIDTAAALNAYLDATAGAEFYLARFVDYRSSDGQFRKYRIMLIAGHAFISHMGISSHWMIHYLNAGMAESADKRAEEERFMTTFDSVFVPRHVDAFRAIAERTGLDYVGIDCGETTDGELLVFEVDSDMIVHAMDPADMFPYKTAPMARLFTAFRELLADTAMTGLASLADAAPD